MANQVGGITRIIRAAGYSWAGYKAAWKNEAAFRQELALAAIMFPLALWLGETGLERAVLAGSALLVIVVELLNSAIEAVVDRFGEEQHELAGRAKDIASAAVLTSILICVLVWGLVLVK